MRRVRFKNYSSVKTTFCEWPELLHYLNQILHFFRIVEALGNAFSSQAFVSILYTMTAFKSIFIMLSMFQLFAAIIVST